MLRLIRLTAILILAMALSVILYAAMRPAQASEGFSISGSRHQRHRWPWTL